MKLKGCVLTVSLLWVSLTVLPGPTRGIWWGDDDDDEDLAKGSNITEKSGDDGASAGDPEEIGSGDIIVIDGEDSTPLSPAPTTSDSTTITSPTSITPATPDTPTLTTSAPSDSPTTPSGTTSQAAGTSPGTGGATKAANPRVNTQQTSLPLLGQMNVDSDLQLSAVDGRPAVDKADGSSSVNIRLRDSADLLPVDGSSGQSGVLHRDATVLQRYIDTCPYCLRRQSAAMVCPSHQMGVEIETWAMELKHLLNHGCGMGPMDRERCCVNGDTRILETLRDMTQRIRDVYHVLQTSCAKCPKDGEWAQWTEWSLCTVTCGSGKRIRTRTCNNPPPSNGGRICPGHGRESELCYTGVAPVQGAWSQWGHWFACSVTCGEGTRMRTRTCNNPPPNACGEKCVGDDLETGRCQLERCCTPVHGNWSPWAPWSQCSATCGVGSRERVRTCTNPQPNECGRPCIGNDREQTGCSMEDCCQDGVWGEWAPWSTCTVSCGSEGVKKRSRKCDSPAPNWCGQKCPGALTETAACGCEPCCVPDAWGSWAPWSSCSAACGRGQRSRSRLCVESHSNPCGQGCGGGQAYEQEPCEGRDCCVPDAWGPWAPWSSCSATCGRGQRSRSRQCVEALRNPCGQGCPQGGQGAFQTQICEERQCCYPDNWSSWSAWSSCSASCGPGQKSRSRLCVESRTLPCRQGCDGQGYQLQPCEGRDCCVPDVWSPWSAWSTCSVTCGIGMSTRARTCVTSGANSCGNGCGVGQDFESRSCGDINNNCCGWSRWSEWTSCPVTCGDVPVNRVRTRSCVTSDRRPCPRSRECPGRGEERQQCQIPRCAPPPSWGPWEAWCPCNCRRGVTSRIRTCQQRGKVVPSARCQPGEGRQELPCDVRAEKSCPDCIMGCSGKADGVYPSCYGCSYYIQCRYYQPILGRCAGRQEWDAHRGQCVTPPSESCSLIQPVTSCQDEADGLYHVRSDCRRYLECRNNRGREQNCRQGREFNFHTQACEAGRSPTCVRQFEDPVLLEQLMRLPRDDPSVVDDEEEKQSTKENDDKKTKKKQGKKKTDILVTERVLWPADAGEDPEDVQRQKKRGPHPKAGMKISDSGRSQDPNTQEKTPPDDSKTDSAVNSSKTKEVLDLASSPKPATQDLQTTTLGTARAQAKLRHGGKRHHDVLDGKASPCHATCENLERGRKYKSCQGCHFYLVCAHSGAAHVRRCHGNREWDDVAQRCKKRSSTCQREVDNEIPQTEEGSSPSVSKGSSAYSKPNIVSLRVKGT